MIKLNIQNLDNCNNDCIVLNGSKQNLNLAQKQFNNKKIVIDKDFLNLTTNVYQNNKQQTKIIQKQNLKKVNKVYNQIKAIVWQLKLKNIKEYSFYILNIEDRQNNNHIMLLDMLELKYNTCIFKRLKKSVMLACNFLDAENKRLNMCDFKNNRCAKHRARNFTRDTGCCPTFCKYSGCGPCKTKNISCKLIMCDYLEDKGFYFSPHTLGQLTHNLSFFERVVSIGLFFKSTRRCIFMLWFVRILEAIIGLLIAMPILELIF